MTTQLAWSAWHGVIYIIQTMQYWRWQFSTLFIAKIFLIGCGFQLFQATIEEGKICGE